MKHTIRATDGTTIEVDNYARAKAIKAFCYECIGWSGNPKTDCKSPLCPLYPFRGLSLASSHQKAANNENQRQALGQNGSQRGFNAK